MDFSIFSTKVCEKRVGQTLHMILPMLYMYIAADAVYQVLDEKIYFHIIF